jgi:hypothetical protein
MKSEGKLALGFTPYSGQSIQGLIEILDAADFTNTRLVEEPARVSVHWAASLDG